VARGQYWMGDCSQTDPATTHKRPAGRVNAVTVWMVLVTVFLAGYSLVAGCSLVAYARPETGSLTSLLRAAWEQQGDGPNVTQSENTVSTPTLLDGWQQRMGPVADRVTLGNVGVAANVTASTSPKLASSSAGTSPTPSSTAADPAARPGPRAAYCLAGYPRSFVLPAVHRSIMRNLVDAFGAPDARIFWMFLLGDDGGVNNLTDKSEGTYAWVESPGELDAARAVMRPAKEVLLRRGEDVQDGRLPQQVAACLPKVAYLILHYWMCYQLVLEDERQRGVSFDFVFNVRPDVAFVRRFPKFSYFLAQQDHVFVVRDWLFLAARELSDDVFGFPWYNCSGLHESVLAAKINRIGAPVLFQCEFAMCNHLMDVPWVTGGDHHRWKKWRCLQPVVIVKLMRRSVSEPPRIAWQWGSAGRPWAELGNSLVNLSDDQVSVLVDRWHSAPMCSIPCNAPCVKSTSHLAQCEAKQRGLTNNSCNQQISLDDLLRCEAEMNASTSPSSDSRAAYCVSGLPTSFVLPAFP